MASADANTTTTASAAEPPPPSTRIRGSVVAHLDTSTPAINASPVEIDGTPTSPDHKFSRSGSWGAAGKAAAAAGRTAGDGGPKSSSPDHLAREEEVLEEFGLLSGGKGGVVGGGEGPSVDDFAAAGLMSPADKEKEAEVAR
ncbi:hypothetical protein GTA08_BOTSDO13332 [Neofusicoccum parvum]|uniref:Uncharacterized protein n=1 Tax=Botryosphaeria parva (strain UCR-NP2) TaxID=1287680 RepID=R1GCF9_BOTPV|nr:hypothetical protein UCRNP2_7360 [Neofusicoccum parvum UCRNP2]GME64684.1 hypothetical protein GTA08_BOTSDO13332 [Neofusicoccum parvum]